MKKKFLGIAVMATIVIAAGWGFIQSEDSYTLSDLTLNNIEALAGCETTTGSSCWINTSTWRCCEGGNYGCSPCD